MASFLKISPLHFQSSSRYVLRCLFNYMRIQFGLFYPVYVGLPVNRFAIVSFIITPNGSTEKKYNYIL